MPRPAVSPTPPEPAQACAADAVQRLCASRQRLQTQLCPVAAAPAGGGAARPRSALQGVWRHWRRQWAHAPLAVMAGDALSTWWQRQPWRVVADAGVVALQRTVSPWVRRHPAVAVALAAGVGAALVSGRVVSRSGLGRHLRPLPQRLGRWALLQLASVPVQAVLAAWVLARSPSAQGDAAEAPPPSPEAEGAAPNPTAPGASPPAQTG